MYAVLGSTMCEGCGTAIEEHKNPEGNVAVFDCAAPGCDSPQHVYVESCIPAGMTVREAE